MKCNNGNCPHCGCSRTRLHSTGWISNRGIGDSEMLRLTRLEILNQRIAPSNPNQLAHVSDVLCFGIHSPRNELQSLCSIMLLSQ